MIISFISQEYEEITKITKILIKFKGNIYSLNSLLLFCDEKIKTTTSKKYGDLLMKI